METIVTNSPSTSIYDSVVLTTGKTMGFFDGKIDKETIFIQADNYDCGTESIKKGESIAEVTIKTELSQAGNYSREFNSRLNTIYIKQDGIIKDCFASQGINVVAEKMTFTTSQDVEIKLKSKIHSKSLNDESVLAFAGRISKNMAIGVGLCVNTNGIVESKKDKIFIKNATFVEVFVKLVAGFNPLNQELESDVNVMLDKTRKQIYLLESELYDIVKMKHLMDIDKQSLGE